MKIIVDVAPMTPALHEELVTIVTAILRAEVLAQLAGASIDAGTTTSPPPTPCEPAPTLELVR